MPETVDRFAGANRASRVLMSSSGERVEDDVNWFRAIGFKLINIYPADDPETAVMECEGQFIKLVRGGSYPAPTVEIVCDDPEALIPDFKENPVKIAPNGAKIVFEKSGFTCPKVTTEHVFNVVDGEGMDDAANWSVGRAGMLYRDLIPSRLGGKMIASHIRIPEGGPVPDNVHFHTIDFQLIFCYKGWVRLVYEDQGGEFYLRAGDCVTQPPEIRHRVLEASDMLEVVEIGSPNDHMTTLDHRMTLPTGKHTPEREWAGQRFVWYQKPEDGYDFTPYKTPSLTHCDTGVQAGSADTASVNIIRLADAKATPPLSHTADALLYFVLKGEGCVTYEGRETVLHTGSAVTLPPNTAFVLGQSTPDFELLEIAMPGAFEIRVADATAA